MRGGGPGAQPPRRPRGGARGGGGRQALMALGCRRGTGCAPGSSPVSCAEPHLGGPREQAHGPLHGQQGRMWPCEGTPVALSSVVSRLAPSGLLDLGVEGALPCAPGAWGAALRTRWALQTWPEAAAGLCPRSSCGSGAQGPRQPQRLAFPWAPRGWSPSRAASCRPCAWSGGRPCPGRVCQLLSGLHTSWAVARGPRHVCGWSGWCTLSVCRACVQAGREHGLREPGIRVLLGLGSGPGPAPQSWARGAGVGHVLRPLGGPPWVLRGGRVKGRAWCGKRPRPPSLNWPTRNLSSSPGESGRAGPRPAPLGHKTPRSPRPV